VTLEEAFVELGLDPDADRDGVRRAYLRLLKTRKPEADPEGFMRLRTAYERVKGERPLGEAVHASAHANLQAAVDAPDGAIAPAPSEPDRQAGGIKSTSGWIDGQTGGIRLASGEIEGIAGGICFASGAIDGHVGGI